ncbi:acetylxylan esterase [Niastella sp. OAS944]|uniref:acetylxylan esterase n=1 Tax=Niastella sp. OAS944 TaxID=2664089 RepID=UPI003472FBB3|nr:cephalosporin-C deacetylase-like acetyl esterase [Chitinophagaceae bacterium OAS944]
MKKLRLIVSLLLVTSIAVAQNAAAPLKMIDFVLTPDAADWNYKTDQNATVQVSVYRFGVPVSNATINYEIGPEQLPAEKKGSLVLKNGQGKIEVGTSHEPGLRQLVVRTEYNGRSYSDLIKLAYSPEQIVPTVPMPADFLQFWDNAKAEAAKVPMDVELTPLPQYATTTVDVFLVNLQNYKKGQRLYGYLCKPKAPGKYPVLFTPPGAGVKSILPYTAYAEQGYISLSIEIHGISPMLDVETYKNISSALGDYMTIKLDDRDNYYYKKVYLGCVRSIDYLCSLPDWDGKNVVVTGGSQGGALSIVTAGLDKRVTSLAAFYPALCDITGYLHGRAGGWPHMLNKGNQPVNNTPEKLKTISYYDVVNFAKQVTAPGFYSWGYNDNTCPPTSVFAAINTIKAPKTIVITPITGHWRFEETNQESLEWLKKQLVK